MVVLEPETFARCIEDCINIIKTAESIIKREGLEEAGHYLVTARTNMRMIADILDDAVIHREVIE